MPRLGPRHGRPRRRRARVHRGDKRAARPGRSNELLVLEPLDGGAGKDLDRGPGRRGAGADRLVSAHARREREQARIARIAHGGDSRPALRGPGPLGRGRGVPGLRSGDRSARAGQGKVYTPSRLAARARLAAHRGELPHAIELARQAVELGEAGEWVTESAEAWLALAEVQGAAGRPADAEAALATARRLYEAKGNLAAASRLDVEAAR